MSGALEIGDRAPGFDLPAVYGYKAGASSPSAEEKVMVKLKDFEGKNGWRCVFMLSIAALKIPV